MQNSQQLSDRLAVVILNFRQWSGQCVLDKGDIQLGQGGELPPDELVHLGSKKIFDPAKLRVFAAIKQRAVRLLEAVGVPYLGGYAVPLEKADSTIAELNELVKSYNAERDKLIADYDQCVREWIDANPRFAGIATGIKTKHHVADRIVADYNVFKVSPLDDSEHQKRFTQTENSLGQTLLEEVAKTARELYRCSMAGKKEISGRAITPLKKIRDRLLGLSFLDSDIMPIVENINATISNIAKHGPYAGNDVTRLTATTLMLCDPERMRDLSTAVLEAQNPDNFSLSATNEEGDETIAPSSESTEQEIVKEEPAPQECSQAPEEQEATPQLQDEPKEQSPQDEGVSQSLLDDLDEIDRMFDSLDNDDTVKSQPSESEEDTLTPVTPTLQPAQQDDEADQAVNNEQLDLPESETNIEPLPVLSEPVAMPSISDGFEGGMFW